MKTTSFAPVVLSLSLAFGALALGGCSTAPEGVSDEEVGNSEDAIISCGAAKYNEALAHYKKSVANAKDRLEHGVCETDSGYLWTIADEASRAVMICGAFRETIKTSPWAAPIRTTLASSLTLRSLTGELLVIKDSQWQNWKGTEDLFAKGASFWAQSNGAYGSRVRIDFAANGKATFEYLHLDDKTYEAEWKSEPATYTITRTGSDASKRKITVKHGNASQTFLLAVEAGWEYNDAPVFTLSPESTTSAEDSAPKLYSLVSECDA